MTLLNPLFGWDEVAQVFRDDARLQKMLDFEAAFARAEGAAGVIPSSAASAIAGKCRVELFDLSGIGAGAALAGNLAIPLITQLKALVDTDDKEAARYVHWGATSQDAIDTGTVLQLRQALELIAGELKRLCDALAQLAMKYRGTVIVGRTWMQHAVPTTLGVKFASWLDALARHRTRLRETTQRCLVLQFGGAVGTLALLGSQADTVANGLARELKLSVPPAPWHSHRDRMAEIATTMGLLTGTLGKIARDISLHMQTEIGEMFEPAGEGRGGSSTMPHKRNPVGCAAILSAATRVPALVSTMLSAMVQEDERGMGGWHAEWETLPEIVCLTGGAVHKLAQIVPEMEMDSERMRENLGLSKGMIFAEGLTAALGEKIGRVQARKQIEAACQRAGVGKQELRSVIEKNTELSKHLSSAELDQLFDARNYSGSANQFIDQVIEGYKSGDKH
ncbi:MAG: 3-carboxy-cis,cis-muconate cycloisomerase [Acidobacteriota bacterium]|nr:3-carboxy-cis,cis-muconate cycloisomerase [Acidobacteriota bacterium]